jgi:peptidoglycan-associated lipoprotein
LALVLCVSVFAFGLLPGCAKQEPEPVVDTTPPPPEPEPEPTPEPTPPPPPDPNIWKREINDVFFDFDKYELRADARAILQTNARLFKDNSNWTLVLEGHADERGTEDYNLALGERRASMVLEYMTDLGVAASRIKTLSYGEERPFTQGSTESAWAQNRRVHFRIE